MLLILGLAALLLVPFPVSGHKDSEHSQEIGVAITQVIEAKEKSWDEIVSEQLKRKAEQDALEVARQAQIEAARAQEQARQAQLAQQARKVRQTAPKRVIQAVSYGNDMSYGQCTYWAKSKRPDLPTGLGNANTWYSRARAMGFAVGSTPRVGAVATTTRGARGHVSIVEQIKGNMIYVSEMNVHGVGVLSYAWYPATDYQYIY